MKRNASIEKLIVQTKPFTSSAAEAIVSLFLTVDRVREVVHGPLAEQGLSGEQYNVLRILRGAGDEGLPTYQVVGRMVARAPNITRLTDKLQEKGLLRRVRSREDRRVTRLVVTDVYPAREVPEGALAGVSGLDILRETTDRNGGRGAWWAPDLEAADRAVRSIAGQGDLVVTIAGASAAWIRTAWLHTAWPMR